MPLDIQTGSLVEKVRRALGVRGRIPLRLDETVVPTLVVDQLNRAPFRSPVDAYEVSTYGDAAAVVGENSFCAIHLPSAHPGALVVHGSLLMNTTAADSYALWLANSLDWEATRTAAPVQSVVNTEFYPANPVLTTVPFRAPWNANLYGSDPVQGVGLRVAIARLPVDQSIYVPLRITLRPGWGVGWWRGTVNQACNASFFATYYPNAERQ